MVLVARASTKRTVYLRNVLPFVSFFVLTVGRPVVQILHCIFSPFYYSCSNKKS